MDIPTLPGSRSSECRPRGENRHLCPVLRSAAKPTPPRPPARLPRSATCQVGGGEPCRQQVFHRRARPDQPPARRRTPPPTRRARRSLRPEQAQSAPPERIRRNWPVLGTGILG